MAPKNEKPLHSLIAGATAGGIEAYVLLVTPNFSRMAQRERSVAS